MTNKRDNDGNKLIITTLGNFNVMDNKGSLTDRYSSSLKLWELFKYLITYRDELLLPERIIDSIWPDTEYQDPKRTLRALIFRLRKILNRHNDNQGNSMIIHAHGCYKLVTRDSCKIDIVEFQELFDEACHIAGENPTEAIEIYSQVIDMYKKGYLSESYEYNWLIPARNHYKRIFLQSVYAVSALLKEERQYERIVAICETTLKYEHLEEGVHLNYIGALAEMGQVKQAKNHYEYVVEIFERELGIKPSQDLSSLYRLICGKFDKIAMDINSISEILQEDISPKGAILCDTEYFKFQYQLEKRRSGRHGQVVFLGMLTISLIDYTIPPDKQLKYAMKNLREILIKSLRKGDIIAQWNKAQVIMSLPGLNIKQADKVLGRIQKMFIALEGNENLILHAKIEEVLPSE